MDSSSATLPDNPSLREQARVWAANAAQLAEWTWDRVLNRADCSGRYSHSGTYTGKDYLTDDLLHQHYSRGDRRSLLGAHSTATDGTCKWAAVDIDAHPGTEANPEANEKAAKAWCARLRALGFRPLLLASNGKGGFHLWVFFRSPVEAALVYAFLRWLTRDYADHSLAKQPECFPKQPKLTGKGYGNWLRLPGRHHSRPHYSVAWDGENWLDAAGTVALILGIDGDDPQLIPAEATADPEPAKSRTPGAKCHPSGNGTGGGRPGDDFNRRATWCEVLEPDGWRQDHNAGDVEHWTRPGKDGGTSATIGFCGTEHAGRKLYVFSDSAPPFEKDQSYDKFSAFTLLYHDGDFKSAAKDLASKGYGEQRHRGNSRPHAEANGNGQAEATEGPADSQQGEQSYTLGDLILFPGKPRQTPGGKITVPIKLFRPDCTKPFHRTTITSAASGLRDATKFLAKYVDADHQQDIELTLGLIIADAGELLDRPSVGEEGTTIRAVVAEFVPDIFKPSHRTQNGIWCEGWGRELCRNEFIGYTPNSLLDAAAACVDAPKDPNTGRVFRPALVRAVQAELQALWSDLLARLPAEESGNLGADSAAAAQFKAQLVRIFFAPVLCQLTKEDGDGKPVKASLISRIHSQAEEFLKRGKRPESRERWRAVHDAFACWWRPFIGRDGEMRIAIGFRPELADQLKLPLISVTNRSGSLSPNSPGLSPNVVGTRFGLLEKVPEVPDRMDRGTVRLAILSRSLTDELLAKPENESLEDVG